MKLRRKVALITGGGWGIGRGIALALAVFFATNDNVTGQAWNVSGGAVLYYKQGFHVTKLRCEG